MPRKYRRTSQIQDMQQPISPGDAPMEPGLFKKLLNRDAGRQFEADQAQYAQDLGEFNSAQVAYNTNRARQEALLDNNERYQRRRAMMHGMPKQIRRNPMAQSIGDSMVDAHMQSQAFGDAYNATPNWQKGLLAGGAGLGTAGIASALAAGQLADDGMQVSPVNVIGRVATNTANAIPFVGGIGQDPLAQARENIRLAEQQLGGRAVVEAVMDQEVAQEARFGSNYQFEEEVKTLASELMQEGSVNSEGEFVPMKPNQAYEMAYAIKREQYALNENPNY